MKAFRALSSASLKELLRNPLTTFLSLVFPMTGCSWAHVPITLH